MKAFACAMFTFVLVAGQVVQAATPKDGGLVTLYSRDPVAHTLCFADGEYGLAVQERQVKNVAVTSILTITIPGISVQEWRAHAKLRLSTSARSKSFKRNTVTSRLTEPLTASAPFN
jgi:hypothetical protein